MKRPVPSGPELVRATAECRERLHEAEDAFRAGELRESAAFALRAAELARRAGRADLLADAALVCEMVPDASTAATIERLCRDALLALGNSDPIRRGQLHGQLAASLHHRERLDEAAGHVDQALALAEHTGDGRALSSALHAKQLSIAGLDRGPGLLELSERMLTAASVSGSTHAELIARGWRLEALIRLGHTVAASHEIDSLEVLAAATGGPLFVWNVHLARAGLDHAVGRFSEAEAEARFARFALPPSQRHQAEPLFIGQLMLIALDRGTVPPELDIARGITIGGPLIAIAMTARYDLEMGDRTRAQSAFEAVRARVDEIGMDRRALVSITAAVELAVAFGDRDLVHDLKRRLEPYDGVMLASTVGAVGPVGYYLSRIASMVGNHDEAVSKAEAAARVAAHGGFGPWHARARLAYADALVARGGPGDRARARQSATLVVSTAHQLGMQRLAARGQELLDDLDPGMRLSMRELEVAGLVAAGASNRHIATRLGLAERTIETHVQHILAKLSVHSRAQVAAWAGGRGLEPISDLEDDTDT